MQSGAGTGRERVGAARTGFPSPPLGLGVPSTTPSRQREGGLSQAPQCSQSMFTTPG